MKSFSFLILLVLLFSCGSDDNSVGNGNGPFTANHANQFIQQIKMKSPDFRPGQMKQIYQSLEKDIAGNIVCDYWDDRTISVIDVDQNMIELETISETNLMDGEPTSCPQEASQVSTRSKRFTKVEYENKTTEFIRYYIDHQYRCSQNNTCANSKFVSSQDVTLKGVPAKLIITEYTYKSGDIGLLESWVSTRSLFEGILAYKMINKKTNATWFRRGFITSKY